MKSPQEWDEMLTLSPMNEKEALRSVRIKPEEIEAIQNDAQSELRSDLHEALSLLDLAMHQGEYGVGEDVRKRYEALKERHKK